MISTVSRESAPKSTNLASAATASSSVPSCSEMMLRTLSSVSWLCARDERTKHHHSQSFRAECRVHDRRIAPVARLSRALSETFKRLGLRLRFARTHRRRVHGELHRGALHRARRERLRRASAELHLRARAIARSSVPRVSRRLASQPQSTARPLAARSAIASSRVPRPRDPPPRAFARRARFFFIHRARAVARPVVPPRPTPARVAPRITARARGSRVARRLRARRVARTLAEALADMEVVKIADIFVVRACAWMCRARAPRARRFEKRTGPPRQRRLGFSAVARVRGSHFSAFERRVR